MNESTATSGENTLASAHASHLRWIAGVSACTAVIAALAAIGTLLVTYATNEARIESTRRVLAESARTSDEVRAGVLRAEHAILTALGHAVSPEHSRDLLALTAVERTATADADQDAAREIGDFRACDILIVAVALLQIAIVLHAIAALSRRRLLWGGGLTCAALGTITMVWGIAVL